VSSVPALLAARLSASELAALQRFLDIADTALRSVYDANVADYMESRGDDAQLFGIKVWKHCWYALEQQLLDDRDINLTRVNGTYEIRLGPLRVGVYGLGHLADEDVYQCFPDSSPFKRGFGEENQLRLFALESLDLPTDANSYAPNSLTLGHFGNPRDGLVKWYLGAWTVDEHRRNRWSWVERQDDPDEGIEPLPVRPQIAPFSDRPRETLDVRARKPA
jgi:hypothetical protein